MAKKYYTNWNRKDLIKEIEQLRKRKKYGLVWEEKPENVVEQCKIELPVLEEIKSKEIITDPDKPVNLLIEGDNYHALSVLNYTHKGKIDVIYIDPPYNTGAKDWKYNNDYVDINDQWRHSKWISFMRNRLQVSKGLLKNDGIMIIAIDDNELATLSLLIDEIFPNKVKNTVTIVHNPHGVSRSGFSRCHEYAVFLLNQNQIINKKKAPEDLRNINLRRSGNNSLRTDSPTMFYPIYLDKKTLKIIKVGEVPADDFHPKAQLIEKNSRYEIWPIDDKNIEKNWYYSRKRVIEKGNEELICKWVKDKIHPYFKHSNNSEQTYKTVWTGKEYDAGAYGSTIVKNITGNNFPFPKSIHAVKDCLKAVLINHKAIILDFFAGSGTTGQAVFELNNEDGGNRKFILCTNNENNIAVDITFPRVKNLIKGYKYTGAEKKVLFEKLLSNKTLQTINIDLDRIEKIKVSENNNFDKFEIKTEDNFLRLYGIKKINGKKEGVGGNLKYYKTSFVPADLTDKNKIALTEKATEMLCIKEDTFEEVKSTKKYKIFRNKKRYTGIIFDHQAIDDFKKEIAKIDGKFSLYIFSLGDDTFDEEFEDMKKKVKLSPIPEAILRVYRRIFK